MTDDFRPPRKYKWADAVPGNTLAMQHGAFSARMVDPLAAEIVAGQLASPSCPPHLKDDPERWRFALDAWGRSEAAVVLIRGWLSGQDVGEALSEHTEATETTETTKAKVVKRTSARRRESALAALDRAERTAAARRNELGLTPLAAARLRLDLTERYDSALHVKALIEQDKEAGTGEQ